MIRLLKKLFMQSGGIQWSTEPHSNIYKTIRKTAFQRQSSQQRKENNIKKKEKGLDFNALRSQVLEELKVGKPLFGKDVAFAPLLKNILNSVQEGGMDIHLTAELCIGGNRRNGKMQKQVQTPVGWITVSTIRDRDASFDP